VQVHACNSMGRMCVQLCSMGPNRVCVQVHVYGLESSKLRVSKSQFVVEVNLMAGEGTYMEGVRAIGSFAQRLMPLVELRRADVR
jgi:hypothetical protein